MTGLASVMISPLYASCITLFVCGILIHRDLRGRVQFPTGGEVCVRGTCAKPASLHIVAKRCCGQDLV